MGVLVYLAEVGLCPPYTSRVLEGPWKTMLWPAVAGGLPPDGCTASHTPSFSLKRNRDEENMSSSVRPGQRAHTHRMEGEKERERGETKTNTEEK